MLLTRRATALLLLLFVPGCGAPRKPEIPAGGIAAPPVAVGVLLLDGVYGSELMAPVDVFRHTVSHTEPGMRVFTVGRTDDPVTSHEGLVIVPDHGLKEVPSIEVLVVPGGKHSSTTDLEDLDLIEWLGRCGRDAKHIVALGDGVFLLAEAGLLRDRCCTPYPRSIAEFRKAYPHIPVVEDVSFVADHETITAAGGARSYEPALYLVEKRFGRPVAEAVARGLLMDWNLETTRHRIVAPAPAETPGTPSRD